MKVRASLLTAVSALSLTTALLSSVAAQSAPVKTVPKSDPLSNYAQQLLAKSAKGLEVPAPVLNDAYVLSPVVVSGGDAYGPEEGVVVESGTVTLPRRNQDERVATMQSARRWPDTVFSFGSSYAATTERLQFWYDGEAEATGRRDYNNGGMFTQRVIEVCFKYIRGTDNVINWRCSTARGGGSIWGPGPNVRETVRDSIYPNAPQTQFRYSLKTISQ